MEENDGNNSPACANRSSSVLNGCQSNPSREGTAHARSGGKEKWSATDTVNEECEADCFNPVCRPDDAIEPVLKLWIGDANICQDFAVNNVSFLSMGHLDRNCHLK